MTTYYPIRINRINNIFNLNVSELADYSASHLGHTNLPPSLLLLFSGHCKVFAQRFVTCRDHQRFPDDGYP
jgi:hypothetical protein